MAFGAAAMDAAVNSSSVEEFMDNGNWRTVGSTILSGIVGVGYGCLLAGLQNSHPNKSSGSATSSPCDGTATCFVAGTLIATENGSLPIEQITAGMLVYATDPDTGETELKEVVNSFIRESSELVHITVNGEEITATPTHPFWVPQKGWTDAIDLRAGDRIQLLNGEYVIIEQVQHELLETPVTVYNFEVEDYHTYYVGDAEVLVHNRCDLTDAPATTHGDIRIGERGLTQREYDLLKSSTNIKHQADGATVYIRQVTLNNHRVLVENTRGQIVTHIYKGCNQTRFKKFGKKLWMALI